MTAVSIINSMAVSAIWH